MDRSEKNQKTCKKTRQKVVKIIIILLVFAGCAATLTFYRDVNEFVGKELYENALKSAKSLYLANKHELWRVDFPSGKVLWKWQAPAERIIIKILETDQDVLVLMAKNEFKNGRFEYYAPSLACLSKSGALKGTQNLGDVRFIQPSINFHHDFRILILGCKFGFSTFEVLR